MNRNILKYYFNIICNNFYIINNLFVNKIYYTFIVKKDQKPLRIDKYLLDNLSNTTRNKIQYYFNTEIIYVNNFLVKKNYLVKPLDVISITMDNTKEIFPENISLNVVYEDNFLIVINKPPGMVVHPGYGHSKCTLLNAIQYHLDKKGIKTKLERIGLVHRIDKETSGLLLVAKDNFCLQHLTFQFFTRSIYRRYIALIWGNLEGYGTIKCYIGRNLMDKKRMDVFYNRLFGKYSVTHYKVLEKLNKVTLVSCRIDTGRTHQIRTHFTKLGYPIFNDRHYGGMNKISKKVFKNYFGQFLHAQSFIFIHPITGKPMHFEVSLPKEMYEVLEKFRKI